MATVLTEVSQFTSSVTVPDDSDAASAASVVAPFQVLADRSQFLSDSVYAGATQTIPVPIVPFRIDQYAFSSGNTWRYDNPGTTSGLVAFALPHFQNCELVSIEVGHAPSATSFTSQPNNAAVSLRRMNITTGVSATIIDVIDPETVAGSYETAHTFTITPASPEAFTAGNIFIARFDQEATPAVNGKFHVVCNMTIQPA